MSTKKNTALVTGATGMLGSRLVFDLLNEGYSVKATYRKKSRIGQFKKNLGYHTSNVEELCSKVEWVEANMLDSHSLFDAVKKVDIVYHTAAQVSFYRPDKFSMFENNIQGTANLVNACLENGVKRFCHISSIAALGKEDEGEMIDEQSTWIPEKKHSGYSISKFHSEMEVWRGINEGLEAVIVNPSIILGPGEWESGSPAFFSNVYNGLEFYTKGITGYVDVRDVSKAIVLLTQAENWEKANKNRFLLNEGNYSYKEIFSKIAAVLKVKAPNIYAFNLMLKAAVVISWLPSTLMGKKPLITRDGIRNANKTSRFDGSKICREFNFTYRNIDETITDVGTIYLNDQSQ